MKTQMPDREDYKCSNGIARWWNKDGYWHIALPVPDPNPETGLRTGGFEWTYGEYKTREEAIAALQ